VNLYFVAYRAGVISGTCRQRAASSHEAIAKTWQHLTACGNELPTAKAAVTRLILENGKPTKTPRNAWGTEVLKGAAV
jgi:hypothetical protein